MSGIEAELLTHNALECILLTRDCTFRAPHVRPAVLITGVYFTCFVSVGTLRTEIGDVFKRPSYLLVGTAGSAHQVYCSTELNTQEG